MSEPSPLNPALSGWKGASPGPVVPSSGTGLLCSLALVLLAVPPGCGGEDPAARVVSEAIERHGGDAFEEKDVTFEFRDAQFRVVRNGGEFLYERRYQDGDGGQWRQTLSNEGVIAERNGTAVSLDARDQARVETAVNSVVYFAFLPFRLQDPAVRLRDLGEAVVEGRPYRKIEVTFEEEGGGADWDDRFVYWISQDEKTLDYMAYRFHRGEGGTRFRRAVNRRMVGGLLIQDWENYTGTEPVSDIADYDRLLEEERLRLVSVVRMERVTVNGVTELAPDDGFEVRLGIDRAIYEPGSNVRAVLVVGNSTDRARTLSFSSAQRYDFVLTNQAGEEVHRWSEERSFAQVLGEEGLEPGGELEWSEEFRAPEEPGHYLLRGIVTTLDGDLSAGLPLEVR